jgi:hypothetical protein
MDVRVAEALDAIRRIERSVESVRRRGSSSKTDGRFTLPEEEGLDGFQSPLETGAASPSDVTQSLAGDPPAIDDPNASSGAAQRFDGNVASVAAGVAAATQGSARTQHFGQRVLTGIATTNAAAAVRRVARRSAPALVLLAATTVTAIVRDDPRVDAAPPASAVDAQVVRVPAVEGLSVPPADAELQTRELLSPPVRQTSGSQPAQTTRQTSIGEEPAGPSGFVGSLSIASVPPGATVFVNGRRVGVTPLELHDRRAGSLALLVTREGFRRWTASVQVSAGELTKVNATLQRITQ